MVFSSFQFLFVFLPVFLLVYALAPGTTWRNATLLAFSLLFYVWGEQSYVLLLLLSIVSSWACALWIDAARSAGGRRLAMALGVAFNLSLLVYFKYSTFLIESGVGLLQSLGYPVATQVPASPHLPLGISFFVFQAISYLVDVYRRDVTSERNVFYFGMYKSSFPQLIAGPIVRYSQVQSQVRQRDFSATNYGAGSWRFVIGLAQKVLLANPCGAVADQVFNAPHGSYGAAIAWIGAIAYALQIYFDFCGYSNMAIGLGRIMGFDFPENFNRPYEARSMTDFWRRWHMSLSSWFRDYVYIPLGGNRVSAARTYLNLTIVFLLCGLWHGAAWTFVAWGAWHGAFLIFERTRLGRVLTSRIGGTVSRAYSLLVVLFGWVIFRSATLPQALQMASTMLGLPGQPAATHQAPISPYDLLGYESMAALALALVIGLGWQRPILGAVGRWLGARQRTPMIPQVGKAAAMIAVFCLSLVYLAGSTFNPFIYFRF